MKLKVLGSGSSGNCYLLQDKKETLIIECGLAYKTILKGLNFNIKNVVGCLISHEHKDHSKAIQDLIKNGIDVYSSQGTFETLKVNEYRANIIRSENKFKIGDFTILPFETQHDAKEPLGFLIYHKDIGKLLFITDSYYCQYNFKDLDHIMIECNYSNELLQERELPKKLKDRIVKSHFELDNVKAFLKQLDIEKVKEIILMHLSNENSNANEFTKQMEKQTGKPIYIADERLEIDLF